jgi:hypothetical protein
VFAVLGRFSLSAVLVRDCGWCTIYLLLSMSLPPTVTPPNYCPFIDVNKKLEKTGAVFTLDGDLEGDIYK